jgi:dTDP-4-amino-4,6-dideoxygalactose transaminase
VVKVYTRHAVNLDLSAYITYFKLIADQGIANGDDITAFEKAFAKFLGATNCVGVSSARAGFFLTLKAMGIGPGKEVIMPAYTFPSMAAAVIATGAKPVFIDADPVSYNIDANLAARAVTSKTGAVVAAHLFGRAAEIERLAEIARGASACLIEDCAHAAGVLRGGKRVGSFGDAAVFSFGIGKNMPCFGGGAVAFMDKELAGKVRKLVTSTPPPDEVDIHKKVWASIPAWVGTRRYIAPWTLCVAARVLDGIGSDFMDRSVRKPVAEMTHFSPRVHGRMANLQAAVGLQQLGKLPKRNATLARNGKYLAEALAGIDGVTPPEALDNEEHIYLYFRVLVPEAKRFRSLLLKRGIDTQADDMANCAGLEAFRQFAADCPVAASLPARSIELPNNTSLTKGDLDYIAASVRAVAAEIASPAGPENAK